MDVKFQYGIQVTYTLNFSNLNHRNLHLRGTRGPDATSVSGGAVAFAASIEQSRQEILVSQCIVMVKALRNRCRIIYWPSSFFLS